jgi:hypothetical protein
MRKQREARLSAEQDDQYISIFLLHIIVKSFIHTFFLISCFINL